MNYHSILEYCRNIVIKKASTGAFCSGGFDSTLLLYYLFKTYHENNITKTLWIFTVPRTDGSVDHSRRVVDWLASIYPDVEYRIETPGDPELHHSQQVLSGIKEILQNNPDITLLLGDTAIPQELQESSAPVRVVSTHPRVVQPFIDECKTTTVALANQCRILTHISQITHTCTESTSIRCRVCWQCRERAWAFSKLGLVDLGLM